MFNYKIKCIEQFHILNTLFIMVVVVVNGHIIVWLHYTCIMTHDTHVTQ